MRSMTTWADEPTVRTVRTAKQKTALPRSMSSFTQSFGAGRYVNVRVFGKGPLDHGSAGQISGCINGSSNSSATCALTCFAARGDVFYVHISDTSASQDACSQHRQSSRPKFPSRGSMWGVPYSQRGEYSTGANVGQQQRLLRSISA